MFSSVCAGAVETCSCTGQLIRRDAAGRQVREYRVRIYSCCSCSAEPALANSTVPLREPPFRYCIHAGIVGAMVYPTESTRVVYGIDTACIAVVYAAGCWALWPPHVRDAFKVSNGPECKLVWIVV
jgi:hypothetical protein